MGVRRAFRWMASGVLTRTGVVGCHGRARRRGGRWGIVLRYHRVIPIDEPTSFYRMGIEARLFEAQMRWLAAEHLVMPLDRLLRLRDSVTTPSRDVVVLTFDDGYRDNFTVAAPILKSLGLPAIFYVSSACMTERMPFWPETLAQIVHLTKVSSFPVPGGAPLSLGTETDRARAVSILIGRWKRLPMDRIMDEMDRLADGMRVDPDRARELTPPVMSKTDVQDLAGLGFSIGSHTVSHPYLASESVARQREELVESRRQLEDAVRAPVLDFCYPVGGYSEETVRLAREAGYRSAVTTDLGIVGPSDDSFRLPRIGVGSGLACAPNGRFSPSLMRTEMSGFFADLYRARVKQVTS
jgi:peptidoglycan/xylan/chitin deacetylase (PgdA/CDA1 family)